MPMVMIKCPKTGKEVPTGIAMDKKSFESSEMANNKLHCPHCKEMHVWNKADAWVPPLH
ncbi:MAG: hypothetical protein ACREHF_13470 [Rhizomicrobium sp.]